jgi:hypothetical protein
MLRRYNSRKRGGQDDRRRGGEFMTRNAFFIAAGACFVAGLIMTVAGHYIAFIKDNVFAIGGMLISLVAGFAYVRLARGGWRDSLIGGAASGAVGSLLAIAVSFALSDVPASILIIGTSASLVTGLIGAALGRMMG